MNRNKGGRRSWGEETIRSRAGVFRVRGKGVHGGTSKTEEGK
jgi:hypothetical protein